MAAAGRDAAGDTDEGAAPAVAQAGENVLVAGTGAGVGAGTGAGAGAGAGAIEEAATAGGEASSAPAGGVGESDGAGDGATDNTKVPDEYTLGFSDDKLEVKTSIIPDAGQGLFARCAFKKGDVVAVYSGKVLRTVEAMRTENKCYLMRLGPQVYVDARETLDVLARFINDCRNKSKHNVVFDKQPERQRALVVATRDIAAGDELYVDYGRWYWAKLKGNRL